MKNFLKNLATIISAAALPWALLAVVAVCLTGCDPNLQNSGYPLNKQVVRTANGHYYTLTACYQGPLNTYTLIDIGTNLTFKAEQ